MLIAGLQKTSLLDYPEKIAAIVFTRGCNFRCGYCHNPELLSINGTVTKPSITEFEFFNFLEKRKGKLDGVVITGGEPCLQNDLVEFITKIKELGFSVKLDTNGSLPEKIQTLLEENLLDYIAMDIKAPLEKYQTITNRLINPTKIQTSINLIQNSNIPYEFRTTVLKSQLTLEDFIKISELISGAEKYYLQKFVPSKIYNKALIGEKNYRDIEFHQIIETLKEKIKLVELR